MANASFSPGLWRALPNQTVVSLGTAKRPAKLVCDCRANDDKTRDEAEANARLIAAAPELLAALTELHSAADAYRRSVSRGRATNEAINRMSATLLQAERAIAKAEGRL